MKLNDAPENRPYLNTLWREAMNLTCASQNLGIANRFWLADQILVGGSIIDRADGDSLSAQGITHVVSCESERTDEDKIRARPLYLPFADGGVMPIEVPILACRWLRGQDLGKVYVHCQMGSSRSVALAIAILSEVGPLFGVGAPASQRNIIAAIRTVIPGWGEHPYHLNYLAVVDTASELLRCGIP